jgi:hypothetical protein
MAYRPAKHFVTLICALACALALAPGAKAVVVGISDQTSDFFSDSHFQRLHIHQARLLIPWDAAITYGHQHLHEATVWLRAARRAHITPLVSFGLNGTYIPNVPQYTRAVRAFIHRFPWVKQYTAWNEPDQVWTPLGKDPGWAAAFFNALVRSCHHCTVVAGDVFMPYWYLGSWLRGYVAGLRYRPAAWALHDYRDLRQRSTNQLRTLLRVTHARHVWLDEVGGIERRGHWPWPNQSPAGADRDEKYLFSLPRRFRQITRIYHYQWRAVSGVFWDSALLGPLGTPRPAYWTVAAAARGR